MNLHKHFADDVVHIHLIDSTSFEIEETIDLKLALIPNSNRSFHESIIFFDPNGEMMYVECDGTLYEWKLRAREEDREWWLGEE